MSSGKWKERREFLPRLSLAIMFYPGLSQEWPQLVSACVLGWSSPGSSPGQGHCVVFLGKTLYSHSVSFQPDILMGTDELNAGAGGGGVILRWTSISSRGE